MLKKEIREIISGSRGQGWVLEPEAKRVVVGPKQALARDLVRVGEMN